MPHQPASTTATDMTRLQGDSLPAHLLDTTCISKILESTRTQK